MSLQKFKMSTLGDKIREQAKPKKEVAKKEDKKKVTKKK